MGVVEDVLGWGVAVQPASSMPIASKPANSLRFICFLLLQKVSGGWDGDAVPSPGEKVSEYAYLIFFLLMITAAASAATTTTATTIQIQALEFSVCCSPPLSPP